MCSVDSVATIAASLHLYLWYLRITCCSPGTPSTIPNLNPTQNYLFFLAQHSLFNLFQSVHQTYHHNSLPWARKWSVLKSQLHTSTQLVFILLLFFLKKNFDSVHFLSWSTYYYMWTPFFGVQSYYLVSNQTITISEHKKKNLTQTKSGGWASTHLRRKHSETTTTKHCYPLTNYCSSHTTKLS